MWYSRPCLRLAPGRQRGLFGVSVLHQSGADNPPFWPGEWGGGGRHPWDGHFPSANSEPSLAAQLPTRASANRSRVLIPTFLQPSPAATPGLGTSMRGRQSAPSCLPEEWWAERRVVQECGRTDYSGEPPPEAEGALALGPSSQGSILKNVLPQLTTQSPAHRSDRSCPGAACPHPSPRRCPLEGLFTPAAPLGGAAGSRKKRTWSSPAPSTVSGGKPRAREEQGGWGHPVSPPRAGPLWSAE